MRDATDCLKIVIRKYCLSHFLTISAFNFIHIGTILLYLICKQMVPNNSTKHISSEFTKKINAHCQNRIKYKLL